MLLAMRLASSRVSALANLSIMRIGVAVVIGEALTVRIHDLETAFWWESTHWIETTRADTSRMLKALTPGGHQGLKGGEGRHWLIPKASIMRLASPRAMRL